MHWTYCISYPDLTNTFPERLINIDSVLCGRFNEPASEKPCQIAAFYKPIISSTVMERHDNELTIPANLPLILEIAFVRDQHEGYRILIFHSEYLLMK